MERINLERITLIAVDCVDIQRTVFAAKLSMAGCKFGAVKILTSLDFSDYSEEGIEFIKIPFMNHLREYSNFMIKKLNDYVDTDFALVFQYDGFVVNPSAWIDKFYEYDYIGAVWNQTPFHVGNGGFSLRSKKILKYLQQITKDVEMDVHPEDFYISHIAHKKFNIATPAIATLFSTESTYLGSFGFHNYTLSDFHNWHYNEECRTGKKINTAVHSGDMGDVIYCIPTFKALEINRIVLNARNDYGTKMNWLVCESLRPLLENEGFEVNIQYGYNPIESEYVIDKWRLTSDLTHKHLAVTQAERFRANADFEKPYLSINPGKKYHQIVVNRSSRYQNYNFDWNYLLKDLNCDILFLGLPDEYYTFINQWKLDNITYVKTDDMLEAAEIIAKSKAFIGNQSSLFAVAEGLKINRIQETCPECPNCKPFTKNGISVLDKHELNKSKFKLFNWINHEKK